MTKTIKGHKRSVESFNSVDVSTYDVARSVGATARIIYAADDSHQHCISGVAWSYDGQLGVPAGRLRILDGTNTVFDVDITATGFGVVYFNYPKRGRTNQALVVELLTGGAGVTGRINVLGHWTE